MSLLFYVSLCCPCRWGSQTRSTRRGFLSRSKPRGGRFVRPADKSSLSGGSVPLPRSARSLVAGPRLESSTEGKPARRGNDRPAVPVRVRCLPSRVPEAEPLSGDGTMVLGGSPSPTERTGAATSANRSRAARSTWTNARCAGPVPSLNSGSARRPPLATVGSARRDPPRYRPGRAKCPGPGAKTTRADPRSRRNTRPRTRSRRRDRSKSSTWRS
jgi:hypothetical protein